MCSVPPDTGFWDEPDPDEDVDDALHAASPMTAMSAAASAARRFGTLASFLSLNAAIHEVHRRSTGSFLTVDRKIAE
jgi:hypothetical protein